MPTQLVMFEPYQPPTKDDDVTWKSLEFLHLGGMTLRTGTFRSSDGTNNKFTAPVLKKIFDKVDKPLPIYLTHDGAGNVFDNAKRPILAYAYKLGMTKDCGQILFQAFAMDPASRQLMAFEGYDCTSAEVDVITDDKGDIVDGTLMGIAAVPVPAIQGTNLSIHPVRLSAPIKLPVKPSSKGQDLGKDSEKELKKNDAEINTQPLAGERCSAIISFKAGEDMAELKANFESLLNVLLAKGFSADEASEFLKYSKATFAVEPLRGNAYSQNGSGRAYAMNPAGAPRSTANDAVSQSFGDTGTPGPCMGGGENAGSDGAVGNDPIAHELAGRNAPQGHVEGEPRTQLGELNTEQRGFALFKAKMEKKVHDLEEEKKELSAQLDKFYSAQVATEVNTIRNQFNFDATGAIGGLSAPQQLVALAKIKAGFAASTPGVGSVTAKMSATDVDAMRTELLREFGEAGEKVLEEEGKNRKL